MKIVISAFMLWFGVSAHVFAADNVLIDEARFAWEGSYLGVQAGYFEIDDDFRDPVFAAPNPTVGTATDETLGFGIFAGHNWFKENVVYGLEADIMFTDADAVGAGNPAFGVFGRAEVDWQASLRGRIGVVKEKSLYYVTGGLAILKADFDFAFPGPLFGAGDQFSETITGFTIGGGMEFVINDTMTAKIEYRYSEYDSADHSITNCCAPPPSFQRHEVTTNVVNFGLSKKLN